MHAISLATHWIHMWSFIQSMEERLTMDFRYNSLD
jgi:hypothetical protein